MKVSRWLAFTLAFVSLFSVFFSLSALASESPDTSPEPSEPSGEPSPGPSDSSVTYVEVLSPETDEALRDASQAVTDYFTDQLNPTGYMAPDDFFSTFSEDEYSVSVISVQSTPNTPVTSSSGLKGILLSMFGPYDPPVTQFRYQANSNSTYTYVNDVQPDYPWIAAAVIFAVVLFCVFKMGGALLCRK